MKVYWTRQHGAWITMIVSWAYAASVISPLPVFFWILLPWSLAGINFTELASLAWKSGFSRIKKELVFFVLYGLISVSGLLFLIGSLREPWIFALIAFGYFTLLAGLFALRLQKSLVGEWLVFSAITLIPFLGSSWISAGKWSVLLIHWLPALLYFCLTPVLLKVRTNELSKWGIIPYLVLATWILLSGDSLTGHAAAGFILAKGVWVFLAGDRFRRIKIRTIGWIETLFSALFLLFSFFA
ncbi:MAG: hypothetical protein L6Q77_03780 [Bacteroidetes bacterium]|nr:hypothetical protein [Bacteroidota bacterium]